jgi:hypothetical protein
VIASKPAMKRFVVLLLLAGLIGGCAEAGEPKAGPEITPTHTPTHPPDLVFVLDATYRVGERVEVKLRNQGGASYRYNSTGYEACNLTYTDQAGREFIIPQGTHCDLVVIDELRPGQTATLFTWDLDECLQDDWGCSKEAPLPPGTYTIAGTFERVGGGSATAEGTFTITA